MRLSLKSFAKVVDTEAVLQESLLRVWQVAPRVVVDPRGDALLRLGVRIARNLAIDHARVARRQGSDAQPEADAEAADELTGGDDLPDPLLRRRIQICVEQLPAKPAAALTQRIASRGGEADELLASKLDMTLNTFLKNFGRARQFLLECLERSGVRIGNLNEGAR